MKNEKIRMDKEGLEKFKLEIKSVEDELSEIRMYKGKTAIYQGDNWHDNPELYQTEAKERSLMQQLRIMNEKLENIEIVEKNLNSDIIDIGDIVDIEMIFAEDDKEDMIIKLVGGDADMKASIQEISINSPLGGAIYGKKALNMASYKVNENTFNVLIKEKIVNELSIDENSKKLIKK